VLFRSIVAAVQPYWFTRDRDYYRELHRLVGVRADRQYPMKSLLAAGVDVAAGSDYPVSPPPDPLLAIQRGVLRRDPLLPETNDELWPDEAVDVETMIEAFTLAGARANFLERETGSLEVGKSADIVVLRENLLELPAERIHEAAVELTLFRGRPVFAAGPFEGLTVG
jgi:predicted amidohydrolase YtcJ